MKVVYKLSCTKGEYRIVDDGNIYLHLYTIEKARRIEDTVAWLRMQGTPIFTALKAAIDAVQTIADDNHKAIKL